jgi:hypothetical protein
MMQLEQVARTLGELNLGVEAMRHATRALNGGPGVRIPLNFAYTAYAPLHRLALLLGVPEAKPEVPEEIAPRRPRTRAARAPRSRVRTKELAEFLETTSAWDPDPSEGVQWSTEPIPEIDRVAEAGNCRALMLEVIRRASFDWVLYRSSSKLQAKLLAESAYHWLFVEDDNSPSYALRIRNGKTMMSFLAICEAMDIEPSRVRARARMLTEKDIMGAGRPPERRKVKVSDEAMSSDEHSVFDVDMDALPTYDPMFVSEG